MRNRQAQDNDEENLQPPSLLVSIQDCMLEPQVKDESNKVQQGVRKVRTQEAENFDEEVKSLVSAWWRLSPRLERH